MGRRGRSEFGDLGLVFFVTTTVAKFAKIFSRGDHYYEILLSSLKHVIGEHKATLFGYVFMPSHIHLIVGLPEGESISDLMRDFKKYTSTKVRQQLEKENERELIGQLRRNVKGKKNQIFKLWMDRFDDVVLESEDMMHVKVDYVHENPVRARLAESAEEWKYSSASNYVDGLGLIEIATDWELKDVVPGSSSDTDTSGLGSVRR